MEKAVVDLFVVPLTFLPTHVHRGLIILRSVFTCLLFTKICDSMHYGYASLSWTAEELNASCIFTSSKINKKGESGSNWQVEDTPRFVVNPGTTLRGNGHLNNPPARLVTQFKPCRDFELRLKCYCRSPCKNNKCHCIPRVITNCTSHSAYKAGDVVAIIPPKVNNHTTFCKKSLRMKYNPVLNITPCTSCLWEHPLSRTFGVVCPIH